MKLYSLAVPFEHVGLRVCNLRVRIARQLHMQELSRGQLLATWEDSICYHNISPTLHELVKEGLVRVREDSETNLIIDTAHSAYAAATAAQAALATAS